MSPRDEPVRIGEVLETLASRIKRVDLRQIDQIREIWLKVLEEPMATSCTPQMIRDGVLVVSVPSGAYAQRVRQEAPSILEGFRVLGKGAPHSIQTRIRND